MFCSSDKLAYFQIRILGISDCEAWHVSSRLILLSVSIVYGSYESIPYTYNYDVLSTLCYNDSE